MNATGFKRPGVSCLNCGKPFALFSATVKNFEAVEKLSDPFLAVCPACGRGANYPKSAIQTLVAVGPP